MCSIERDDSSLSISDRGDALHLAAALTLGPDLAGIVVYDDRLRSAAVSAAIEVAAPGTAID